MSGSLMPSLLAIGLALGLTTACTGRQSFEEASDELAELIGPAVEIGFAKADRQPERNDEPDQCSDPFVGPSQGLRPNLIYEMPLSSLGEDPESFVASVESLWQARGLKVEADDSGQVLARYATKDRYSLSVLVSTESEKAIIEGSGPCVDDPNAD